MTTLEALLLPLPAAPLEVVTLGAAFTTLPWFRTDFIVAGCWKLVVS